MDWMDEVNARLKCIHPEDGDLVVMYLDTRCRPDFEYQLQMRLQEFADNGGKEIAYLIIHDPSDVYIAPESFMNQHGWYKVRQ